MTISNNPFLKLIKSPKSPFLGGFWGLGGGPMKTYLTIFWNFASKGRHFLLFFLEFLALKFFDFYFPIFLYIYMYVSAYVRRRYVRQSVEIWQNSLFFTWNRRKMVMFGGVCLVTFFDIFYRFLDIYIQKYWPKLVKLLRVVFNF